MDGNEFVGWILVMLRNWTQNIDFLKIYLMFSEEIYASNKSKNQAIYLYLLLQELVTQTLVSTKYRSVSKGICLHSKPVSEIFSMITGFASGMSLFGFCQWWSGIVFWRYVIFCSHCRKWVTFQLSHEFIQ